jgi:hypothetical protein
MATTTSTRSEEELVPGTEILLHLHGNGTGAGESTELCLVPEPSNQPDDPLVRISVSMSIILRKLTFLKELEPNMESNSDYQSSYLRVHQHLNATRNCTLDSNLHS